MLPETLQKDAVVADRHDLLLMLLLAPVAKYAGLEHKKSVLWAVVANYRGREDDRHGNPDGFDGQMMWILWRHIRRTDRRRAWGNRNKSCFKCEQIKAAVPENRDACNYTVQIRVKAVSFKWFKHLTGDTFNKKKVIKANVTRAEKAVDKLTSGDVSAATVHQKRVQLMLNEVDKWLDCESRKEWQLSLTDDELQKFEKLVQFLEHCTRALATANVAKPKTSTTVITSRFQGNRSLSVMHGTTQDNGCMKCAGYHVLYKCPEFLVSPGQERYAFVKSKWLCFNCLGVGRMSRPGLSKLEGLVSHNSNSSKVAGFIMGRTKWPVGRMWPVGRQLDSPGLDNAPPQNVRYVRGIITCLASNNIGQCSSLVQLELQPTHCSAPVFTIKALVMPKLTGYLPKESLVPEKSQSHITGLRLADPLCNECSWQGRCIGVDGSPFAIETDVGWVLSGSISIMSSIPAVTSLRVQCDCVTQVLRKFWELEEIRSASMLTKEQALCEHHFVSHEIGADGRYVVRLPFRDNLELGESRVTAVARLHRIERNMIPLVADVAKMYRQIRVKKSDMEFQRIVRRSFSTEPILDYRLLTVTYREIRAPYLAIWCLKQLATDEEAKFPLASRVAMSDFYVDDLLSEADSIPAALKLQAELINLLASVPLDMLRSTLPLSFSEDSMIKTLGLEWHPTVDQFAFTCMSSRPEASLVGFCDASKMACAAVVYLRSCYPDGTVLVRQVSGKMKVAPLKQISIPRLELCGAMLLAKLLVSVQQALLLDLKHIPWTDSTIVLAWLACPSRQWKTFVANRVSTIQDLVPPSHWYRLHEPGPLQDIAVVKPDQHLVESERKITVTIAHIEPVFLRAATTTQLMADLPAARVHLSRPFLHCGVDYAGPFLLRNCKGCSRVTVKAPCQGGLWEAGVKSMKFHLYRVVGHVTLNFEEFYAVLTMIEVCLNSCPLTALSSDPGDLSALTPGHFMIVDSLLAIPEVGEPLALVMRVLVEISESTKMVDQKDNLHIGDMVILKDEQLPAQQWKLDYIVNTFPGVDGLVQTATLRAGGKVIDPASVFIAGKTEKGKPQSVALVGGGLYCGGICSMTRWPRTGLLHNVGCVWCLLGTKSVRARMLQTLDTWEAVLVKVCLQFYSMSETFANSWSPAAPFEGDAYQVVEKAHIHYRGRKDRRGSNNSLATVVGQVSSAEELVDDWKVLESPEEDCGCVVEILSTTCA
ncbi:hypothetical protein PR048_001606 [Dryococelus australis]|uniref:DUF5641 domain-containing protein n=1 Tax=Dryococelus australis TaxID=614101 RepID=A0ABQ9IHX5_9NEOP|nr:hypothetical protein PR048_001606 [Dryococelus australis]